MSQKAPVHIAPATGRVPVEKGADMKSINNLVNEITDNIISLTGYDKAVDIQSILYMNLSGYTLEEECTELSTQGDELEEAVESWCIELRLQGCTERTMRTYAENLKQFLMDVNKDLKDIREKDIKSHLAKGKLGKMGVRCTRPWADTTYNLRLRVLRSFFGYCYENDLIPENPCKRIKDTKTAHIMQPVLTAEQREIIRSACWTERELALVDMFYSSGVRVSELVAMNRQDIDFRTRHAKCFGKGRKEREIMFSAECSVHLAQYLSQRTDYNEALFVSKNKPYHRLTPHGIRALLKEIKSRDPRLEHVPLSPHVYRRTRGTDLINRGMPAELIAKKFGHQNVQTLLICYADISKKTVWDAEEKYG